MKRLNASRREFLRNASALSILGPASVPFALNLAAVSAASAQAGGDYRALVCLFMNGGNDQASTVLATDAESWNEYQRHRGGSGIALGAHEVLPISPVTSQPGRQFALHPNLAPLRNLFDAQRLAVVANVGPLVAPLNKHQYDTQSIATPPKLFSHNDQEAIWQANAPEGARAGWGGRMGDLIAGMNGAAGFTAISAAGNVIWLSGHQTLQYQVARNGGIPIHALNETLFNAGNAASALRTILRDPRSNLMQNEYAKVTSRSIDYQAMMASAILPAANLEAVPADNAVAAQLQTVARIIGGRSQLGMRRQMFFVNVGGFDTHASQMHRHGGLMTTLAEGMSYFDRLLAQLNLRDNVTLFTASDFGRALAGNGSGTDHGWGSHHFVMGGAVKGRDIYGRFPQLGSDTSDDVGNGRLLPALSVDQYGATMARWFGLSDGQLNDVFPNLPNYGSARDLGFMRT